MTPDWTDNKSMFMDLEFEQPCGDFYKFWNRKPLFRRFHIYMGQLRCNYDVPLIVG